MLFDTEATAVETSETLAGLKAKFRAGNLTNAEWKQFKMLCRGEHARERTERSQARESAKERTRREWAEIRSAADDVLRENAPILDAFRHHLTALFEAMRQDKEPFKRRPNISLRLIALGDPPAKVITLPHVRHDATGGYLIPSNHTIELMEKDTIRVKHKGEDKDADQLCRKLTFNNTADFPPTVGRIYKSAVDDARRIIATIRDFLDDSRSVLARGCDHCCICGRHLTDELSRSRGIGPECIQKTDIVAVLAGTDSFILPEPVA
jgi:hypothetical protein